MQNTKPRKTLSAFPTAQKTHVALQTVLNGFAWVPYGRCLVCLMPFGNYPLSRLPMSYSTGDQPFLDPLVKEAKDLQDDIRDKRPDLMRKMTKQQKKNLLSQHALGTEPCSSGVIAFESWSC